MANICTLAMFAPSGIQVSLSTFEHHSVAAGKDGLFQDGIKTMHRLILDTLSGQVLDASTDEVLVVEIPDDQIDLDLIESMVNNWSVETVCKFAEGHGWTVTDLDAMAETIDILSDDETMAALGEYPIVPS